MFPSCLFIYKLVLDWTQTCLVSNLGFQGSRYSKFTFGGETQSLTSSEKVKFGQYSVHIYVWGSTIFDFWGFGNFGYFNICERFDVWYP